MSHHFNNRLSISVSLLGILLTSLQACNTAPETGKSKIEVALDSLKFKKAAYQYQNGKEIFKTYCTACHTAPEKKVLDQYLFDHLFERLPEPAEEYFSRFIKNSADIKSQDNRYARDLRKMYDSTYEHVYLDKLSNKEIDNLIVYIKIAVKEKH